MDRETKKLVVAGLVTYAVYTRTRSTMTTAGALALSYLALDQMWPSGRRRRGRRHVGLDDDWRSFRAHKRQSAASDMNTAAEGSDAADDNGATGS